MCCFHKAKIPLSNELDLAFSKCCSTIPQTITFVNYFGGLAKPLASASEQPFKMCAQLNSLNIKKYLKVQRSRPPSFLLPILWDCFQLKYHVGAYILLPHPNGCGYGLWWLICMHLHFPEEHFEKGNEYLAWHIRTFICLRKIKIILCFLGIYGHWIGGHQLSQQVCHPLHSETIM